MFRIGISIFAFLLLASCLAAQDRTDIFSWIDTQTVDNKYVIRGWCQNNSPFPTQLKYHAEFFTEEEKLVRKGSVLASPLQPMILSKAIHVAEFGELDSMRLLIFHKNEQVHVSNFTIPKAKAIHELPSEKTVKTNPPPAPAPPSSGDAEIDGLILDETRSKLAHDFYELFYNSWTAQGYSASGRNITIREMPNQIGIGSRVIVEVDGRRLTNLNLQPRAEVIERLANQLVEALNAHLQDPNNFQEIDSDDLNGSGIY